MKNKKPVPSLNEEKHEKGTEGYNEVFNVTRRLLAKYKPAKGLKVLDGINTPMNDQKVA
tara:strand:+ start:95 stop:271 length:177 start_codon:yes stop_codon:yes gene_type:complete